MLNRSNKQTGQNNLLFTIAAITTIIMGFLTVFRGLSHIENGKQKIRLFLCNENLTPRADVAIVGSFDTVYPDDKGTVWVDGAWIGNTVQIHDKVTWRLLVSVELRRIGNDSMIKIIIPEQPIKKQVSAI